jgi:hypothetical protein
MKYIITESQLKTITESQEYLNFLLDKINQNGYESLNDREKDALIRISKGEEVYDEPNELPVSDDIYRPNDIFLKYAGAYGEIEVDDQVFRVERMEGTNIIEIMGEHQGFAIEPNLESNEILLYEQDDVNDVTPVKYKNIPETTEGMRKLAIKFMFQILPQFIRERMR